VQQKHQDLVAAIAARVGPPAQIGDDVTTTTECYQSSSPPTTAYLCNLAGVRALVKMGVVSILRPHPAIVATRRRTRGYIIDIMVAFMGAAALTYMYLVLVGTARSDRIREYSYSGMIHFPPTKADASLSMSSSRTMDNRSLEGRFDTTDGMDAE